MGETKRQGASAFPDPGVDYRRHPDAYRVGRGERGVLTVEPYKSELLPLWAFRTPDVAQASADALYAAFVAYRDAGDFVGADMARKFLQMGYTRSQRYARHRSGRKYDAAGAVLPDDMDVEKARSAAIFLAALERARADEKYRELKRQHQDRVRRSRSAGRS
jgi:hypothetical protein